MPYIGKQPLTGAYQLCDTITTSATATYNLLVGGSAVIPGSAQNCIVSLNGVIQAPVSAFTVSGSTITFSSTLSSSDVIDFILILGNVFDIGTPTNGTVTPSSIQGGTSGLFTWQSVQTTGFTAVAGRAYPCNTTSAAFTVTLPATPSVGQQILLLDYAGTFDTNALTINPNGNKIESGTLNVQLTGEREGVTLTYIDSTQGWLATSGINEGTDALSVSPTSVDFLVVAGGGGGGVRSAGGGGGGGFRSFTSQTLNISTNYTVTVGAGGAGSTSNTSRGTSGSDSVFSTTTSTGGGGGGSNNNSTNGTGLTGGSGGGGAAVCGASSVGGAGNTPSTSPSQGNNGGDADPGVSGAGGGGGGASAVGSSGVGNLNGGAGGNGTASSITGSSITYAGGGGGGASISSGTGGTGGTGGGGNGGSTTGKTGGNGTANTGGGGGGHGSADTSGTAGTGGSGIVILKYSDLFTLSNPGGGLTFSTSSSGGFKVTSFTAGTGTIQLNL